MAKNIEPNLRKIGEYLKLKKDTIFIIPQYQRAYSWQIEHCDKLWQDIKDFIESENKDNYFFGTIIINCQENDTKFSLIDGQQRTTTFLLLLKALLLKFDEEINKASTSIDSESKNFYSVLQDRRRDIMEILYQIDRDDISGIPNLEKDKYVCSNVSILENLSINELYKTELKTILQAVTHREIEENVTKIPYKQKDNRYTNFVKNFKHFSRKIEELSILEVTKFAKTFIQNCEIIEIKSWQVEQAITMFNSLNSDGLPLYDANIISAKLYAVAETKNQGDEFTKLWKELLKYVEDLKRTKIANIDSILLQQMYYERAKNKETLTSNGNINVTTPGVRRYFENNRKLLNEPIKLCNKMITLSKMWKIVSDYSVAQVLFKFNENFKLFIASYLYRFTEDSLSEEKIKVVFECMLRLFTILELVDAGYSSNNFKTFLFKEELKLIDPDISEGEIKTDFDNHIRKNWNKENIKAEIIDSHKSSLVFLNEYLFAKETNTNFTLVSYNIEHIMPDSGRNLQEIRRDADIDSKEEFLEIVNKLGNKILLEEDINKSIGNEWFRTKVSTTLEDKTGYINSTYPIACDLVRNYKDANKPYWKKGDICKATEKASERIVRFIFGETIEGRQ